MSLLKSIPGGRRGIEVFVGPDLGGGVSKRAVFNSGRRNFCSLSSWRRAKLVACSSVVGRKSFTSD